jgi:hypothetical protein
MSAKCQERMFAVPRGCSDRLHQLVLVCCPMIYFRRDLRGLVMPGDASEYIGNIPQHYDRNLGPLLFVDYAADISRRVAACSPQRVLEIAPAPGSLRVSSAIFCLPAYG